MFYNIHLSSETTIKCTMKVLVIQYTIKIFIFHITQMNSFKLQENQHTHSTHGFPDAHSIYSCSIFHNHYFKLPFFFDLNTFIVVLLSNNL